MWMLMYICRALGLIQNIDQNTDPRKSLFIHPHVFPNLYGFLSLVENYCVLYSYNED